MDIHVGRSLPEDILFHIFGYLSWECIWNLRLVSKACHYLLSNPTILYNSITSKCATDGQYLIIVHQPKNWLLIDDTGNLRIRLHVRENVEENIASAIRNIHVWDTLSDSWHMISSTLHRPRNGSCVSAALVNDNLYLLVKLRRMSQDAPQGQRHNLARVSSGQLVPEELDMKRIDGSVQVHSFQHGGALTVMTGTQEPREKQYHRIKLRRFNQILSNLDRGAGHGCRLATYLWHISPEQ
ncbi:hypothetical protein R1flu_015199 [Riccia fluitans]|uniref:F-box domain-containing protein n=1 Tax=Riccia fluitans TaxID=41844 RepID=A0ABD1YI89_9MARC